MKLMLYFSFTLMVLAGAPANAKAALFADIMTYPEPLVIRDTTSGNSVNALIEHRLDSLPGDAVLSSFELLLTHEENSNSGPTAEIWYLTSPSGDLLKQLEASLSGPKADFLALDAAQIQDYSMITNGKFTYGLAEWTSFNSETFRLLSSELRIQYEPAVIEDHAETAPPVLQDPLPPSHAVPETPEPGTLFLLGSGLLGLAFRRRTV